jgi:proteic killer suppression protein
LKPDPKEGFNWRMTFYFEGQDAYLVDYMDYH